MSEIIRIQPNNKKRKEMKLIEIPKKEAPDLSFLSKKTFLVNAASRLEKELLEQGIIIPKDKFPLLSSAFIDIGKAYWEQMENSKLF